MLMFLNAKEIVVYIRQHVVLEQEGKWMSTYPSLRTISSFSSPI